MNTIQKSAYLLFLAVFAAGPVLGEESSTNKQGSNSTIGINHEILYKVGFDLDDLPDRIQGSDSSDESVFGELRLRIKADIGRYWQASTDLRGFGATGSVSQTTDDDSGAGRTVRTSDSDSFLQLRGLWLRYQGLTDYPEEHLTLGLQRLRSRSSLFWDGYVESMVWQLKTTRFDFQAGAGERFDTYRTNTELSDLEKDKSRFFSELSYDWLAYHELTVSAMYADQDGEAMADSVYAGAPDGVNGEWFWYGVGLSSNWNKRRSLANVAYNLQWMGLSGTSNFLDESGEEFNDHDISAWAVDGGLRYDFSSIPFSLGATFAQGSGGFDENESNMYVQTGLHTNRETYTGNKLNMYRFNEALRADLTNLRSYSIFGSSTIDEKYLLAGSAAKFDRVETDLPVYRLSEPLDLENDSADIGWGVDLAFRHLVDRKIFHLPVSYYGLRTSSFMPGGAFADDTDSLDYAIIFEIAGTF